MNPSHAVTMERQFDKDLNSLEGVFDFLDHFLAGRSVDPTAAYGITLAVEEFFTNIVKYGGTRNGTVSIVASIDNRQLRVELIDVNAERFDPTTREETSRNLSLEERPIGGLGIHLSREMLDDVRYEYSGRTGKITLVKNLEQ